MTPPRRRTRDEILTDLADAVTELVEPIQHNERYEVLAKDTDTGKAKTYYHVRHHKSVHASLLDQIRECTYDKAHAPTEQLDNPMPRNTAHLDLDAVDRLDAINKAIAEWRENLDIKPRGKEMARDLLWHTQEITRLFGNPMPRPIARLRAIAAAYAVHIAAMVEPDLRAFVGHAATLDTDALADLARDVNRWRTWCRIVAGWDTRPWQPRAACPQCGDLPGGRAGLRVRAEIQAAVCLSCDATWDPDGVPIAVLGEHIRQVREALEAARRDAIQEAGPIPDPGPRNRGGRG